MKKQTILKILALILLVSILIVSLFACHNCAWTPLDSNAIYFHYKGVKYPSFALDRSPIGWNVVITKDMVKKVGLDTWLFPVYVTNEDPAYFLVVNNYRGNDFFEFYEAFEFYQAYVHPDLEIKSVYDVAYQKVLVEYKENVPEEERCLSEYPEGTTFKDIAGDNIVEGSSSSYSHYGMFICIYPGIEYLRHYFYVYKDAEGQLYLSADDESYNETLYKLPITIPNKTEDGSSSQTTNN